MLRVIRAYPELMKPTFDVIVDGRFVSAIDPEALLVVTGWLWRDGARLLESATVASVIREGPIGFLFAGLLPTIVNRGSFYVTSDAKVAFEKAGAHVGLMREVDAILADARSVPREVQVVRSMLDESLTVTLEQASAALGISPRSLRRHLALQNTSFHEEVLSARLAKAQQLLLTTDLKISAVGAKLCISERAVTLLFRSKTGLSPIEWRDRHRVTLQFPRPLLHQAFQCFECLCRETLLDGRPVALPMGRER